MPQNITLSQLFKQLEYDLGLKLIAGGTGLDEKIVAVAEVNRPGLALCGQYDYFANDRIQVMGAGEIQYVKTVSSDERRDIFRKMLSYDIPCFVVTRGLDSPQELIEECDNAATPLFSSHLSTPAFVGRLVPRLEDEFGPSTVVHGDFIEAFIVSTPLTIPSMNAFQAILHLSSESTLDVKLSGSGLSIPAT